jgi:membrane protein YdbS with pleckstrin-like domain
MSDSKTQLEFSLHRDQIADYFFWHTILLILLTSIWFFGLGILLAVGYAVTLGMWLPRQQAGALRYWLEGSTLRVDQGVYFLKRKAIPLDRITDVVLAQGPLLRHFGIWTLNIQTAGTGGQALPEAILYGLANPETIRDELLQARDQAAGRNTD